MKYSYPFIDKHKNIYDMDKLVPEALERALGHSGFWKKRLLLVKGIKKFSLKNELSLALNPRRWEGFPPQWEEDALEDTCAKGRESDGLSEGCKESD